MRILVIASILLAACGGSTPEPAVPEPQTAEAAEPAPAPAAPETAANPLTGTWHGEVPGPDIAAVRDWEFRADGTYEMTGYPSIGERGHWRLEETDGALTVHLTERLACGPCETSGPTEPSPDAALPLSIDGDQLEFERWTYLRQ